MPNLTSLDPTDYPRTAPAACKLLALSDADAIAAVRMAYESEPWDLHHEAMRQYPGKYPSLLRASAEPLYVIRFEMAVLVAGFFDEVWPAQIPEREPFAIPYFCAIDRAYTSKKKA